MIKNRSDKLKKIILPVILLALLVTIFTGCGSQRDREACSSKEKTGKGKATLKQEKNISREVPMPEKYTAPADKKGTLEYIDYDIKLLDGTGRGVKKNAVVYLPPGYTKNRRYNILYWMHGWRGSQHTYLGWKLSPRPMKNLLDNMIKNCDIDPVIVVTPTYTNEYEDYYTRIERMGDETVRELIPAVEGKYSTYAKNTTKKEIIKSRAHRAFGGFSMGGCTTWYILKNHVDTFKYYLPSSIPMYYDDNGYIPNQSKYAAKRIAEGIIPYKYGKKDYYIYAASGSKDFMNEATKMQALDLSKFTSQFRYTDKGFHSGNITFQSRKNGKHGYEYASYYVFNGLIRFFKL